MPTKNFDTLSQAVDALTKDGYKEQFESGSDKVLAAFSKTTYTPEELVIVESYRFEGETNPADSSMVLAIKASDGTKGTMVMTYGANHNQDDDLIKRIPFSNPE